MYKHKLNIENYQKQKKIPIFWCSLDYKIQTTFYRKCHFKFV